ncbi:MAG: hypothetical protein ACPF9Q_05000 [Opitutales bacterium]
MKQRGISFSGLCLGLLLALTCSAQHQSGSPAGDLSYSFTVFYLNYATSQDQGDRYNVTNLKFLDRGAPVNLVVHHGSVSRQFAYRGQSSFSFVKEIAAQDGVLQYRPLLSVDFGTPGQKMIVLLRRPDATLQALVYDLSVQVIPSEVVWLINLSRQTLLAKIDEKSAQVAFRQMEEFPAEGEGTKYRVPFVLAYEMGNTPQFIERRRLAVRKNGRVLLIVYPERQNPMQLTYHKHGVGKPLTPDHTNASDKVYNYRRSTIEEELEKRRQILREAGRGAAAESTPDPQP